MIKLPWRKRVKIRLDDLAMECFIKDMLSCPEHWISESMFQTLIIDINVRRPAQLRRRILNWLTERRVNET